MIKQDSSQQILARRKSSKSQNGGTRIYAKLMAVANSRSRKPSLTSVGSTGKSQKEILLKKIIFLKFAFDFLDGKRLMVNENSIRSQADIDADLKVIYGDARYVPCY